MCSADTDPPLLEQTLKQLTPQLGEELTNTLQPILHLNEKRCRTRHRSHPNPQAAMQSYILEVARRYQADHTFLYQLQQQKSAEVWEPLLNKIRRWAYSFLSSWDLNDPIRLVYTVEIAQEASLEIVRSHYPYDCEFDAWACTVTQHISSKYMQRQSVLSVLDDIDLSEAEEWLSNLNDNRSLTNPEIEIARKQALLDAVTQLSDKQKIVIWNYYFEGWTLSQIATRLDVNVNAVYKRHFDALKQLRKILGPDWYKDE